MLKKLKGTVIILVLLFCMVVVSLQLEFKPTPDSIMRSVVHIGADAGWQGSGVYIGNGLILLQQFLGLAR